MQGNEARLTIKIFIDTNIFVSAFFFNGNERIIVIQHFKNMKYYTSQQVIDEVKAVLSKKFNVNEETVDRYVSKILLEFILSPPKRDISVIVRDIKDTDIIKSAIAAKCDYLSTGDKDLLTLKQIENTKIISSSELFEILK